MTSPEQALQTPESSSTSSTYTTYSLHLLPPACPSAIKNIHGVAEESLYCLHCRDNSGNWIPAVFANGCASRSLIFAAATLSPGSTSEPESTLSFPLQPDSDYPAE